MSRYLWLSGASRGLGLALAESALAVGWQVYACGRGECPASLQLWQQAQRLSWATVDLGKPEAGCAWLQASMEALKLAADDLCVLILNAGTIEPLTPLTGLDEMALATAMQLNLLAPMRMTGHFAKLGGEAGCMLKLLAVSSGAGRRPSGHWSAYCVAKAGLDMLVRVANTEAREAGQAASFQAVALAPGVIDTNMQEVIRRHSFPSIGRYRDLHAQGQLQTAAKTAEAMLDYLDRADFGSKEIDDIRDYL